MNNNQHGYPPNTGPRQNGSQRANKKTPKEGSNEEKFAFLFFGGERERKVGTRKCVGMSVAATRLVLGCCYYYCKRSLWLCLELLTAKECRGQDMLVRVRGRRSLREWLNQVKRQKTEKRYSLSHSDDGLDKKKREKRINFIRYSLFIISRVSSKSKTMKRRRKKRVWTTAP